MSAETAGSFKKLVDALECLVILSLVVLALRIFRFENVCSYLKSVRIRSVAANEDLTVARLGNTINKLADASPWEAKCLPQYITLFLMLARRGIGTKLVMGVYKFPFQCHVWLENESRVLHWQSGLTHTDGINKIASMTRIVQIDSNPGRRA